MFLVNMIILVALVQLLIRTEKPELCAGIYTGVVFIIGVVFGSDFLSVLIGTAITGALSYLYFWLLSRTLNTMYFWIVMVGGLLIGLV